MAHISFHVPMVPQGENPICWIACVAMITSFKTKATQAISEFTGGFDPSGSCIPDPNSGWDSLYANLKRFGFTPDGANMSINPKYIEETLKRHGPFMIFVFVADFPFSGPMCLNLNGSPGATHAGVVTGIDTLPGKVDISNPWGTNTPSADLDVIVGLMQAISDTGCHPAAYMP